MPVRGHYKVCLPGYPEYLRQVGALFLKSLGLLAEQYRIKHYPIAYEIDAIPENTGRDGTQHDLPAVKLKSVSGIGAALETRHRIITRSKHVNHFSFSFVAPLETKEDVCFNHSVSLIMSLKKRLVFSFLPGGFRASPRTPRAGGTYAVDHGREIRRRERLEFPSPEMSRHSRVFLFPYLSARSADKVEKP